MNYWSNKENNKRNAIEHITLMETIYANDIELSIKNSKIYSKDFYLNNINKSISSNEQILKDIDTVGALNYVNNLYPNKSICVMNFASYKNPGGKFLEGSMAQEESLCHNSTLYNVLKMFPSYYDENKRNLNRALYTNRAIFSPNIVFTYPFNDPIHTNVLTCAAPNTGAYTKYNKVDKDPIDAALMDRDFVIDSVLMSRISFIKDILVENQVDIFIYGAFGCGVFKNDPKIVAEISKSIFGDTDIIVIYAIPYDHKNYIAFENVINK